MKHIRGVQKIVCKILNPINSLRRFWIPSQDSRFQNSIFGCTKLTLYTVRWLPNDLWERYRNKWTYRFQIPNSCSSSRFYLGFQMICVRFQLVSDLQAYLCNRNSCPVGLYYRSLYVSPYFIPCFVHSVHVKILRYSIIYCV